MTVKELKNKIKDIDDRIEGLVDSSYVHFLKVDWDDIKDELLQLIELKKPFAVQVEIPETVKGLCSPCCTFSRPSDNDGRKCDKGLGIAVLKGLTYYCKPGPGCPRFEGE